MKAILYLAESQNQKANKDKLEVMSLWAEVHEVEVVGIICEANGQMVLGEAGKVAITKVLEHLKPDAVIVLTAGDLGNEKSRICEQVQNIHFMGAEVISIQGDLPNCADCKDGPKKLPNYCTVTLLIS